VVNPAYSGTLPLLSAIESLKKVFLPKLCFSVNKIFCPQAPARTRILYADSRFHILTAPSIATKTDPFGISLAKWAKSVMI